MLLINTVYSRISKTFKYYYYYYLLLILFQGVCLWCLAATDTLFLFLIKQAIFIIIPTAT